MKLSVYAPASIGNFSVGFDALGAALKRVDDAYFGDMIELSNHGSGKFEVKGKFANQLPQNIQDNIIYHCLHLFHQRFEAQGGRTQNLHVTLSKNLPVASGLGSSGSSIVAMLKALNNWYHKPFNNEQLLQMMGQMEGSISGSIHYDNIAPCFQGGLLLMGLEQAQAEPLPWYSNWFIVVAHPGLQINTEQARALLPKQVDSNLMVKHSINMSSFIRSLYLKEPQKTQQHFYDLIAEPYRKSLYPNFDQHKKMTKHLGAIAMGISGSGPSLFAVCKDRASAEKVNRYFAENYAESDWAFSHICQLDAVGARVIKEPLYEVC